MNKFLLEDFAGGAVAERIRCAIQEVYENIANPNMEAEKARKLEAKKNIYNYLKEQLDKEVENGAVVLIL